MCTFTGSAAPAAGKVDAAGQLPAPAVVGGTLRWLVPGLMASVALTTVEMGARILITRHDADAGIFVQAQLVMSGALAAASKLKGVLAKMAAAFVNVSDAAPPGIKPGNFKKPHKYAEYQQMTAPALRQELKKRQLSTQVVDKDHTIKELYERLTQYLDAEAVAAGGATKSMGLVVTLCNAVLAAWRMQWLVWIGRSVQLAPNPGLAKTIMGGGDTVLATLAGLVFFGSARLSLQSVLGVVMSVGGTYLCTI